MSTFEGFSETGLFAVSNFGDTSTMKLIFFSRCSEFDRDFRRAAKRMMITFLFVR